MAVLHGFSVNYNDDHHHVRILLIGIGFSNPTTVSCVMQLADNGGDKPVSITVEGSILFFGAPA